MRTVEDRMTELTVEVGEPPPIDELAAIRRPHPSRYRIVAAAATMAVLLAIGTWLAPDASGPARVASEGRSDENRYPAAQARDYRDISARVVSTPSAFSVSMLEGWFPDRGSSSEALYQVVITVENDDERLSAVTVDPWRVSPGTPVGAIGNEQCPNTQDACNSTPRPVDMNADHLIIPLYFKDRLLPHGRTVVDADVTVTDVAGTVTTETVQVEILSVEAPHRDRPRHRTICIGDGCEAPAGE